jgi:KDO2-lipid IV(A) lauroyltransferase
MFYRFLSRLPLPLLYLLAWPGYLLLYHVTGYRKEVVRQNLSRAFPEKSAGEITELAKKFYRQLVQVALEILRTRRMSADEIRRRVTVVNPELLREYSNDFRESVVMLAIHQGNWEWMLHGVKLHLDIPIDPVYKPLHNSGLNQLMLEIRSQFGSRPIPIASAARDILRRRREFRLFVLVADQAPIEGERSHWTRFMNRQAAFHEGGEAIAKMTGYPVLFARCRRRSRGYYEVEFSEVARPPYDDSEHRIVENYVRLAERAIRAEPESWLWSNRRWKRRPPQEEPDHPA